MLDWENKAKQQNNIIQELNEDKDKMELVKYFSLRKKFQKNKKKALIF